MGNINQPGVDGAQNVQGDGTTQPKVVDADALAQASLAGLPPIDAAGISNRVSQMLNRAGFERDVNGNLVVTDATAIERTSGVNKVTGDVAQPGLEAKLSAPAPRPVEMTSELAQGAESFAHNLDQVVNEMMVRPGMEDQLRFGEGALRGTGNPTESRVGQEQAKADAPLPEGGLPEDAPRGAMPKVESASGAFRGQPDTEPRPDPNANPLRTGDAPIRTDTPQGTTTPGTVPQGAPPVGDRPVINPTVNQEVNAAETGQVQVNPALLGETGAINPEALRKISEMTADMLMAIFLKLNITDPNNSVDTHNALHEMASSLRQTAIDGARQKSKIAAEQMKEAQAYADQVKVIGDIITVVMIIVTIVLTIVTFGAGAALFVVAAMVIGAIIAAQDGGSALDGAAMGGAIASLGVGLVVAAAQAAATLAAEGAKQVAQKIVDALTNQAMDEAQKQIIKVVMAIVQALGAATKAVAQNESVQRTTGAQLTGLDAKRLQKLAEQMQAMIEEESEIMKMIMESKNAVVDAVMKMMQAMFATSQKLMSAGMAKG